MSGGIAPEPSVTVPDAIAPILARARTWAIRDALPFWGGPGWDAGHASFHERVSLAGQPLWSSPRRTMTQARQIYVFAHAALLGWFPQGRDLALMAARSLIERHWRVDGADGWVFSIDPDGAVADARRELYAHAFAIFGLAWAFRLDPQPQFRCVADETFTAIETRLAASHGGHLDAVPRPDDLRRQNPHMHLFEACLAWFETTGDPRYLDRAGDLFKLFATRFLQRRTGAIAEYFDDVWQPAPGAPGRVCEPGHHFEWVWLLRCYERATGQSMHPLIEPVLAHALRHGRGSGSTLYAAVRDDGLALDQSCRTWVYAEAIKAALVEHEAGRPGMDALIAGWHQAMFARHLAAPFPGCWLDHLDADGKALVDFVPASTLYHVILSLAETERVFGRVGG